MERKDVLKEIEDVMGQGIKQHIGKLNDALNHAHGELSKDVREYDRGLNDAWKLAGKIALAEFDNEEGLSYKEVKEIFGKPTLQGIFMDNTVQEALEKIKAYEKKQEEIKVGDILLGKYGGTCIVTKVRACDTFYGVFSDGSSGTHCKKAFTKTGKHIDIQKILDEIGVMNNGEG